MAIENTKSSFETIRDEKKKTLRESSFYPENPQLLYKDYVSDVELNFLTLRDPEVQAEAVAEKGQEWVNDKLLFIPQILKQRIQPYRRPSLDYDILSAQPEFAEDQKRYEDYKLPEPALNYPGRATETFQETQRVINAQPPKEPIGTEESEYLSSLGFNPQSELTGEDFKNKAGMSDKYRDWTPSLPNAEFGLYRFLRGLLPRNPTLEDEQFLGKQFGLDGDWMYSEPSKGKHARVLYKPKDGDWKMLNSPDFNWKDSETFIINEAPAMIGDAYALAKGKKRFLTKVGATGNIAQKTAKVTAMGALSGLGAAGGDYIRLLGGKVAGAHDRDDSDMLKEAGVIGAWSVMGTAAISALSASIFKIYNFLTGKVPPVEMQQKVQAALSQAKKREEGIPTQGVLFGGADEISSDQINAEIKYLTDKFSAQFRMNKDTGKVYNPTIAASAGTRDAADLEAIFLTMSDDPTVQKLYGQMKDGNQEVIDEFVRVLREKIGPVVGEDDTVTSAALTQLFRVSLQDRSSMISKEGDAVISKLKQTVGGTDDVAVPGLYKEIQPDGLFSRPVTRIQQIKLDYKKPFDQAWTDALRNPRYSNLTGAGSTRKPIGNWLNQRKGEVDALFRSADADKSVKELFNLIPSGASETLLRLRGRGSKTITGDSGQKVAVDAGRFESPNFSIDELNNARVALNEFRSNLPDGNAVTYKLAKDLMDGLESQMRTLVREGAETASINPQTGKKLTKGELDNWIVENKWGKDLEDTWDAQRKAYADSNSPAMRSLLNQDRPEKVIASLLETGVPSSKQNKPISDLVKVLEREGADELQQIREGFASYIQREVLDQPGTPREIATAYRAFIKKNEGTLRAAFGNDKFGTRFFNKESFKNTVVGKLNKLDADMTKLHGKLGITNPSGDLKEDLILSQILKVSPEVKQSGSNLEKIKFIRTLASENPELEKKLAQVTKRFILQDVLKSRPGTAGAQILDFAALNKLLTEGFGPSELTGKILSFDEYYGPLLGKEAKDFIKTLKTLNSTVQKEAGASTSPRVAAKLTEGDFGAASGLSGLKFVQRMFQSVLSKAGRRTTALAGAEASQGQQIIGRMLLDQDFANRMTRVMEGQVNKQQFIRFATASGLVAMQDLGDEMQYYDTDLKRQQTPKTESFKQLSERLEKNRTQKYDDFQNKMKRYNQQRGSR